MSGSDSLFPHGRLKLWRFVHQLAKRTGNARIEMWAWDHRLAAAGLPEGRAW